MVEVLEEVGFCVAELLDVREDLAGGGLGERLERDKGHEVDAPHVYAVVGAVVTA